MITPNAPTPLTGDQAHLAQILKDRDPKNGTMAVTQGQLGITTANRRDKRRSDNVADIGRGFGRSLDIQGAN